MSADETIWADALHPESVRQYGNALSLRAQTAQLFQTGLSLWDEACDDTGGGLDEYWYCVIGGASNAGKTQLLIALAQRALRQGFAVAIITMEEPLAQLQRRIYASISELGYYDFTYDRFRQEHVARLVETTPYLGKLAINDDLPSEDLHSIIAYLDEVRDMLFGRPMVVFLDNLQLVKPVQGQSIAQAATEVSEGLRKWAKENRTLTFALSQLTAEALRNTDKPPRMYDLWGGSAMYSNASQVVMIDHTARSVDINRPGRQHIWLLLDKNRYGPNLVAMPVETNLKTGEWRCAQPDEEHLWKANPWGG